MKVLLFLSMLTLSCSTPEPAAPTPEAPAPLIQTNCGQKPVVIAVIDTGFGYLSPNSQYSEMGKHLCKYGHKSFVAMDAPPSLAFGTTDPVPADRHGHGTNIVGTIVQEAEKTNVNFCIVVIKYFDPKTKNHIFNENIINTVNAIDYAREIHADIINYSGGGVDKNPYEVASVKAYIDGGGTFFAAAGNEHSNLSKQPYYPAMNDDRVIVVGALDDELKKPAIYSDYGKRVDYWSDGISKANDLIMRGTSQATAHATGVLLKNFNKCTWAGQ